MGDALRHKSAPRHCLRRAGRDSYRPLTSTL
ncbi:hypothetical protein GIB57_23540 [Pseudomonas tremae]|uniref:DUF1534 domain-containing protein n=1 Tax=Pseudomonas coronafaciens pv. coronafaciens TaxID=235275 RepID=A0AAE6UJX0_9PSED|nr:hypothetical protein [Pseudomonas tremae]QGL55034.1 hypothetical protein POR16_01140 [Pseudomonas coronafaciens pv. oryzae str. 1_6]QGT79872.1 hypothetical protein GMO17_01120 [Pseudomonas coronafaciens pv. coronafaciens]MCF5747412.1 hypothetical protein [Pseudomonas tremae]MCF5801370.1 hypothetical protein [Pseudomonas tremae]